MREDDVLALAASRMIEPMWAHRFSTPCPDRRHVARLAHLGSTEFCDDCIGVLARKFGVCRANAARVQEEHLYVPHCPQCGKALNVLLSDDGVAHELGHWERPPRSPDEWASLYVLLQSMPQGHDGWGAIAELIAPGPTLWERVGT